MKPVPDLGYCREIVVTAVCGSGVGPSNVAFWPLRVRYCAPSERQLLAELRKCLAHAPTDVHDPGCSLIPGQGSSSPRTSLPVQGSLRGRGVPSASDPVGADFQDIFHRSARYVDNILHGAKPSELPVQLPTKYLMVVNLKTAKALGLTVPPTLLATADEVIE
jgi:hypothetical protein